MGLECGFCVRAPTIQKRSMRDPKQLVLLTKLLISLVETITEWDQDGTIMPYWQNV